MARLSVLLKYGRRSDVNRSRSAFTKAGALLEALIGIALVVVITNLLLRSGFGPESTRLSKAHQLWVVLMGFLFFLPLGYSSSVRRASLVSRPFSVRQIYIFELLSPWTNVRCFVALLFALASLAMTLQLPHPGKNFLNALLLQSAAVLASWIISLTFLRSARSTSSKSQRSKEPKAIRQPMLRRELRSLRQLADPWIALFLSVLLSVTEIYGHWIEQTSASVSGVLIGVLFIPIFLMPFGPDGVSERARQRLLPIKVSDIVLRKNLAASCWLLTCGLPLALALAVSGELNLAVEYIESLLIVLAALSLIGSLLFPQRTLLGTHFAAGAFAGNYVSVIYFIAALAPMVCAAVAERIIINNMSRLLAQLSFIGVALILVRLYVALVRRADMVAAP